MKALDNGNNILPINPELARIKSSSPSLITLKDLCWLAYLFPGRALSRLSPDLIMALQGPGAWMAKRFARTQHYRLTERLRIAGLREVEIKRIIDHYLHRAVGRALSDLVLDAVATDLCADRITIEGIEYLHAAQALSSGVLLVSGHFFASRLAKQVLRKRGMPVVSIRHPAPPDPAIGRIGRRWIQPRYMRFLHQVIGDEVFVQAPDSSIKILQRLRAGELVNIHIDSPFASHSVRKSFLGRHQIFTTNFIRLARLADSPILPFFFRGDHRRLHICFEPHLEPSGEPDAILGTILTRLQQEVMSYPSEYELWIML